MSLVNTILENYNNYGGGSVGSVNRKAYANATVEGYECDYAMLECLTEIVNADRIVASADVMGSMTMLLEGTDVSVAMEGVIANACERIKNAFLKLKDTIVAWFKKAIDWIVSFTKNGKAFVEKYGDIIKKKDLKGFKYSGYVWTKAAGDAVVDTAVKSMVGSINGMINDLGNAADASADSLNYTKVVDHNKDYKETVIKGLGIGATTMGEINKEVSKAYRNGKDSHDSDMTLNSGQVTEYLGYIADGKDLIKKLKEDQSKFEKELNAVIKTLNTIARKEDKSGDKSKNASAVSKCLNDIFVVKRRVHDAQVANYRTMLKSETSIMRQLLHYNPKDDKKTPVQNGFFDPDLYEMFAADPMLESDDIASDETDFIEECDDFTEESTNLSEGAELYSKIAEMLGI